MPHIGVTMSPPNKRPLVQICTRAKLSDNVGMAQHLLNAGKSIEILAELAKTGSMRRNF